MNTRRLISTGAVWGTVGVALSLPAVLAVRGGYLSDTMAQYVARALVTAERPRLDALGFDLMPLPTALLSVWPSALAAVLLSGLVVSAAVLYAARGEGGGRVGRLLRVTILVGVFASPVSVLLAAGRPDEALGVGLLYAAGRQYQLWVRTGVNVRGFRTGLLLALALFATPVAFPFAILLAAHQLRLRRTPEEALAAALVVVYPIEVALLGSALLSWMFGSEEPGIPMAVLKDLPLYPAYAATLILPVAFVVLLLLTRRRDLSAVTLPAIAMSIVALVGWPPSPPFVAAWLALAATDRAAALGPRSGLVITAVVMVQLFALWAMLPLPSTSLSDAVEAGVAVRLRQLPSDAVLADDRVAYRLVARTGTAAPFLLPGDHGFGLARLAPRRHAAHVLACPGPTPLGLQFTRRAPPGYRQAWTFAGCRFYSRLLSRPPSSQAL